MKVFYLAKIPYTHGKKTQAYFFADSIKTETKNKVQFQAGEKTLSIRKADLIGIEKD